MPKQTNTMSRRTFVAAGASVVAAAGILGSNPVEAFGITGAEKQKQAADALNKLDALKEKAEVATDNYDAARSELEEAQKRMADAEKFIAEAGDKIATLQSHLGTRARGMYRNGSYSFLDVLLSATTFKAFASNWALLNEMNEADSAMVEETKNLRTEMEAKKVEYAEQEKIAKVKEAETKQVKEDAQKLAAEMQATYNTLSAEAKELLDAEKRAREAQQLAASQKKYGGQAVGKPIGTQAPAGSPAWLVRAYSLLGAAYDLGADGPNPIDCSGFVGYALTGVYGHHILGDSRAMARLPRVDEPYPGVICCKPGHVALYLGGGQIIHANGYGRGVQITPMGSGYTFHHP